MNTTISRDLRALITAPGLALILTASFAIDAEADTDVLVGEVDQFTGPDDLHLDPALAIIAVDVYGDQDREVNGVTFQTDGQQPGVGTATNGGVSVTTAAANQINNWTNAPSFTGADQVSADNLQEIMRDIRWNGAPNPVTVDIEGLTPGSPYEIQLLTNEGADRNRRWDIAVEDELVVDDYTSEGLHTQVWSPNNSAYYKGEFTAPADGIINIRMQQNFGGAPNPGGDNNPILQAVIVHLAFISVDGDALNDPFEQKIIDADGGDAIATLEDVLEGDDFDNDGLTNLEEQTAGADPTNPDTDGDGTNDGADAFPLDSTEDTDTDSDGVGDNTDNCPNDANPEQTDTDGDGEGDACDEDDDNDGLTDSEEGNRGTDPLNPDSDGDGLLDGVETNTGTFVDANDTGTDPNNVDSDGGGIPDGFEVANGTDPNDDSDDPAAIAELHTVSVLPTGVYPFVAGGEGFTGYVHNDGTHSWLLVGRGRNGWEFDADGQGTTAEVGDAALLGTPDAFGPAMYSEALINDLIDISGTDKDGVDIDLTGVEIRISRAANPEGTSYSEARWRSTGQTTWRSNFDTAFNVEHEIVDGGGATGADVGIRADGNTRDTELGGNDGDRIFTWGWDGHALQKGFSYGSVVSNGENNDTSFLWENGNENHAIPYAELYIRLENPDPAKINLPDTDNDGIFDIVETLLVGNLDDLTADGDFDNDGVLDPDEVTNGTDPTNDDSDDDGLKDGVETNTGTWVSTSDTGTDPLNPDSDGDGLKDGVETNTGNFASVNDTGTDPNNEDTDGDGFNDRKEVDLGSDPNDVASRPAVPVLTDLGTGTGSLIGGDLTDPEDDGDDRRDPLVPGDDLADRGWNFIEALANEKSSFADHEAAFNVFDNKLGPAQDKWCCGARNIVVGFEEAISLTHFTLSSANDVPNRDWKDWTVEGGDSLDGPFELIYAHEGTDLDGNPGRLWPSRLQVIRFDLPRPSRPYTHFRFAATTNWGDGLWQVGEIELFGTVGKQRLFFDVENEGDNLVLAWESQGGELYNLRSETDPANGEPGTWPIYDGQEDIEATPPFNTLTISRPADAERFFVIEAFPAPPESIFSDDFESGQGDWTVGSDGAAGTAWELGIPTAGPGAANSPANAFGTNLAADYGFDADIWLRSPPIDLTTAGSATLNFFEFQDIEEGFDAGSITVLDAADDSVLAVIEDVVDGTTGGWELFSKAIPLEGLGKVIKIEFRFNSDDIQNFAGWYVDDVLVTVP